MSETAPAPAAEENRSVAKHTTKRLPKRLIGVAAFGGLVALFAGLMGGGDRLLEKLDDGKDREPMTTRKDGGPLPQTEAEWRAALTPEQFSVLRKQGTERAFSGEFWNSKEPGIYCCAGCSQPLFRSQEKYDSGTGWPSFFAPLSEESVATRADYHMLMRRTEVVCSRCAGHLGHVFEDGPAPTGLRYCLNSAALTLQPEQP